MRVRRLVSRNRAGRAYAFGRQLNRLNCAVGVEVHLVGPYLAIRPSTAILQVDKVPLRGALGIDDAAVAGAEDASLIVGPGAMELVMEARGRTEPSFAQTGMF